MSVEYCSTHVGHKASVALNPLSSSVRQHIAGFLRQRFLIPSIVRAIRNGFLDPCGIWNVRNVMVQPALEPGKLHENDLESVRMRIVEKNKDDGIRLFIELKDETGAGFLLVIVTPIQEEYLRRYGNRGVSCDDTHNSTRYNMKLMTMTVVDACRRRFPAVSYSQRI